MLRCQAEMSTSPFSLNQSNPSTLNKHKLYPSISEKIQPNLTQHNPVNLTQGRIQQLGISPLCNKKQNNRLNTLPVLRMSNN